MDLPGRVLLVMMPVFFGYGSETNWTLGGATVFVVAGALCWQPSAANGLASSGRKDLKWQKGEASIIAWLFANQGFDHDYFANILLDKGVITNATFTALLLMAIASTMLTVPVVQPKLAIARADSAQHLVML